MESIRIIAAALACCLLALSGGRSVAAAANAGYLIHGGDQLNVVVYGEQSLTGPVTVLPDGSIDLALVGKVHVGGQTPDQAADSIKAALQKFIRHPVVTVAVAQVGQVNVMVLGAVKTPGKYPLPPTATLTDAIGAAGGLNPISGQLPDARVGAPSGQVSQVSLEKLLHQGDSSLNVPLQDGSIVYVPSPVTIAIQVVGTVDHPGEVDLKEGDRLSMAIAMAGTSGSGANADLNNITVTRTASDGSSQPLKVNLYKTLQGGDITKDLVMQKGDIVYVPQNRNKISTGGGGFVGQSLYFLISSVKLLGL